MTSAAVVLQQLRQSVASLLRTPGFSATVLVLVGLAVAALSDHSRRGDIGPVGRDRLHAGRPHVGAP